MYVPTQELTADQVLQAFHHDAPNLFLGAVIVAVGLVAAALAVIRRKFDEVLIYLALFAILYGLRIWMRSNLMQLSMQGWWFYPRLMYSIDFTVAIPAFFFFKAAGMLRRQATIAGWVLGIVLGSLALATLLFGAHQIFYQIANVLVVAGLIVVVVRSAGQSADNQDMVVIRRGGLVFVAFILWENIRSFLGLNFPNIEVIGFMAFLGALGYVAARQTIKRDQQLNEIQKELEVAKRIQLSILPREFPASANFKVAARYVPMTSVAGDFYDIIVNDGQQAGLLIADVSGHGVPAALIASMVKVAANSQRANSGDPAGLLAGMNGILFGNTQEQFVTAAYIHLDAASKTFRYSAAGHPAMMLLRSGKVRQIVENGLMLAAFDFAAYSNMVESLHIGDRFLLYTDGVMEAGNAAGDFFGQEALADLMRRTAELSASDVTDRIISEVRRWAVSQDDDWTVLVCDYAPATPA